MADKKLSSYTAKAAKPAALDLLPILEWNGTTYDNKTITGSNLYTDILITSNNLSDLTNTTTARTNLGLGSLATQNGTFSGTSSGTNTGDQTISDATISLTDITTNDFSTTKHGFVPKGTNTGKFLKDDGTWSTISAGGLTYFTEAQSTASPNATVNVDSLTAIASTTNADISIVPKGTGAFTLAVADNLASGGNKRGANSVDMQTSRSSATQVASGNNSFLAGRMNTASGGDSASFGVQNTSSGNLGSFTAGWINTASNQCTVAMGFGNIASALYSSSFGNSNNSSGQTSFTACHLNTASGISSFAVGSTNTASGENSSVRGYLSNSFSLKGRWVVGNGNSVTGDAQKSTFILSKRTTDATPSILAVDNLTVTATNQLVLQNNNSIRFKGSIIARQSGSTNTSAWDIDGIIQRGVGVGTTTIVGLANVNVVSNLPLWGTPAITANTTLGCLKVTVTGASTTNIQWTCVIDTTEVIYA